MPTVDPTFRFVWLIWASAFLLPWSALFAASSALRRPMLWASALTAPLGLTQLLFVPAYWNPPSLFDLAQRTGLDVESLIFCFAIGGLAAAGYRVLAPASEQALAPHARNSHLHRRHRAALASPFFVFVVLLLFPWNPIYPGIAALFVGALASGLCRPDLWRNTLSVGWCFWRCTRFSCSVWNRYGLATSRRSGTSAISSPGGLPACRWRSCFSALASACIGAAFTSTSHGGSAVIWFPSHGEKGDAYEGTRTPNQQ